MTVTLIRAVKEINVMDFAAGATIDDGATDATAAFQAAIDAIAAYGAGKLVIPAPASSYKITDTLTILSASPETQLFLDIEMLGRNGAIRFNVPNKPLFHTKGWKNSHFHGVRVQLGAAAANAVVWEVDADATYQSTGELTFSHCLCDFLTGGNNVGWRFGAAGGGYDFSVIHFDNCQVSGVGGSYGDVGVYNYSINGLGWHFDTCGASGIHTWYADAAPLVTLNGGIDASVTTIPLGDHVDLPRAVVPTAGIIQIDSEKIAYTGRPAGSLTGCTRGYGGTTPATHADGAAVRQFLGSNGPSGGASMIFTNQLNSNTFYDFLATVGGDYAIRGGRFENGKRFLNQYAGSSPNSFDIATDIADYTPADEKVFLFKHPGSIRLHLHATRPGGSSYTGAFMTFDHAGKNGLVVTGCIQAAEPPYAVGGATVAHDLSKGVRLSDPNTVAAMFTA